MEAIESIKIVQVDGLTNGKGGGSGAGMPVGGSGNLAQDAVSAALAYRAQAPVLDGLLKELGLDGSSLGGLVKGAAGPLTNGAGGESGDEPALDDDERSEEHTSELQSRENLVCGLLLEKKKK